MSFDVASIREYRADGGMRYVDDMPHNSLYHAEGVALWGLILGAYGIKTPGQLENLPHWCFETLYTIDAKSDSATDEALAKLSDSDAKAEKRHMLQVLLGERFHLQIHPETRMSNTYELIATSRTAKLMTPVQGDVGKTISTCSMHFFRDKGAEVDSKGCPFHIFFSDLQQNLGTDVLDRTGMTGVYAYHLMWWPAQLPEDAASADRYPPLRAAVREQLGLELKPAKGPVTFWVVDHIERPTPN
ncbi:MAG TPA: TIGR03435 family protein [Candidatus Aquilonibacter sp.]|nr:TIGR03435 family protein [Candidatus Aquilonibacter sp.]